MIYVEAAAPQRRLVGRVFIRHGTSGVPGIRVCRLPAGTDVQQAALSLPKGGAMMGGGDMSRMMAMMHGGMMGDMQLKHVEGRLAFRNTELKITPAQEPQWTRFAEIICSTAKTTQAAMPLMKHGGAQASSAPDRLGHYEKTLTSRIESVRVSKGGVDQLYASLSDDQKKVADELLMGPMRIM